MVHDLTNANVSKDGGVLSQSSHASGSRFDARVARSQDREAPCLVARHPMFPCKGSHPEPMDQDDGVGRILNIGHVSPLSLGFLDVLTLRLATFAHHAVEARTPMSKSGVRSLH